MSTAQKSSLGVNIFIGLLIVGFIAAGIGALNSYLQQRAENAAIAEDGAEVEASVIAVTEKTQFRGGSSFVLTVSFEPKGSASTQVADVTVCTEGDYTEGDDSVQVVYAVDDPAAVRLAECKDTVDSSLGLVFGIIFLGLGLFFMWGSIRSWMKRRDPAERPPQPTDR